VPTPVGPVAVCPGSGVQFVGWFPLVAGGRQICQFTVFVVEPVPAALKTCDPRTITVAVEGVMATPTGVEFPPHPATEAASNAATLSFRNFILSPPSVSNANGVALVASIAIRKSG
jgi:hypothetical protein